MPYILDKTNIFLLQKIFFMLQGLQLNTFMSYFLKIFLYMNRKKNKGLNSMPVAARRKKSSAKTANAAKTNALPKPVSPFIVLRCLADIYGVDKNTLSFAVAEIPDGEDGFDLLPVVLIANSGEYIDLVHGIKVSMSHSAARAGRHNFFAAVVKYDNGDFVFSAPRTEAKVNKSTLVRHYGTAIVSF